MSKGINLLSSLISPERIWNDCNGEIVAILSLSFQVDVSNHIKMNAPYKEDLREVEVSTMVTSVENVTGFITQ